MDPDRRWDHDPLTAPARALVRHAALVAVLLAPAPAAGQQDGASRDPDGVARVAAATSRAAGAEARSGRDAAGRIRLAALRARGFRLVVSLDDRRLTALIDDDTLRSFPVAVAADSTLSYQGRTWRFATPRGRRRVVAKDSLPVWVPPEWHYYEVAGARDLTVAPLERGAPVPLSDGRTLGLRGDTVGVTGADSVFTALPPDHEIVFDGVLYIPPIGSVNRRIEGELGRYRLDLGGGYLLHGTPYAESLGRAATHGCIRVGDFDIAWLYEIVPVGTPVYLY